MKHAVKAGWITLGTLALGCGIAGVVLPLVPTTPFVLLAAFAFARSSPRLHAWLLAHAQFGPLIRNWERDGAIDRRTKIVSASVMAATPLVTAVIGAPWWAIAAQCAVLLGAGAFVVSRPEPSHAPIPATVPAADPE